MSLIEYFVEDLDNFKIENLLCGVVSIQIVEQLRIEVILDIAEVLNQRVFFCFGAISGLVALLNHYFVLLFTVS